MGFAGARPFKDGFNWFKDFAKIASAGFQDSSKIGSAHWSDLSDLSNGDLRGLQVCWNMENNACRGSNLLEYKLHKLKFARKYIQQVCGASANRSNRNEPSS